ncbi:hypothetical protein [Melittangium boletus]|uniref:Uncharacterized protein n=1 Tax=Melittangium boletus DSM 14713 TaxID=1294270 RepID=A0A250I8A8_9BACT|nr:hypothetical protein [Melittangium boletus]ATB27438.1 hypothetical protein MEBOL_000880 [Melittangium boletus DSM 14713]
MPPSRDPSALALELLRSARPHVRARSRSPGYYQAADRFSEMFLGRAFQLEPDYFKAVGTDYSAIDCLYEELGPDTGRPGESPEAVTERLQEMTRPGPAYAALVPLEAALEAPTCSLLDVCRALLGAITVLGHESLERRGLSESREDWSRLWQDRVWRQNSQQARLYRLIQVMRAPPEEKAGRLEALGAARDELRVRGTGFARGVHEYLERYGETGAASVALVGGLPFSQALTPRGLSEVLRLLQGEADFLGRMARLMRFAQDVRFDPTEPLNSGVMGYAAEYRQNLADLDATRLPKAELDTRLREEWNSTLADTRQRFDTLVSATREESARSTLQGFVTGFYAIAARLVEAGHEP